MVGRGGEQAHQHYCADAYNASVGKAQPGSANLFSTDYAGVGAVQCHVYSFLDVTEGVNGGHTVKG